jgi:hypothetical protein
MATLKHLQTGADIALPARTVIGRSRACQLQIDLANVSALHAEVTWNGRAWQLRDRGSKNGTFVEGRKIPPGQQVTLEVGAELGFGAQEGGYRFIDDSAPRLMVYGPDGVLIADSDVLCLPSPGEPEAMVFRGAGGRWVFEDIDSTRPLDNEDTVVVGGRPYVVHLPGEVLATSDVADLLEDPLDEAVFEFMVSRDGEHVDLRVHEGDRMWSIESRAHVFLLLALARARLSDAAEARLPASEHGWMHRDDVMKELAITEPPLLNLWVHRARQQLAQMKVPGASMVIERREAAGQLRLGLTRVRVIDA